MAELSLQKSYIHNVPFKSTKLYNACFLCGLIFKLYKGHTPGWGKLCDLVLDVPFIILIMSEHSQLFFKLEWNQSLCLEYYKNQSNSTTGSLW